MVWSWDAERLQHILGETKPTPRIIPETLLFPKVSHGLRLLQVTDGFEIQYWNDGSLRYSHSCRRYPTAAEWLSFQRESALPLENQVGLPESAEKLAWNKQPWLKNLSEAGVRPRARVIENISALFSITLLAGLTAWLATQTALLTQEIEIREERIKSLEQALRPLREARQGAMEALTRSKALARLATQPDQFQILTQLAEAFPENTGAYIREWEYQSGKLKLTMNASNASVQLQQFMEALQGKETFFKNVAGTAASDGKSMTLELDIAPQTDSK